MQTKSDFSALIDSTAQSYPGIAALYLAGDPYVRANLDAIATMLAMYSAQQEVAAAEPFDKSRDATVLANAALLGILRKASPARVTLSVRNDSATSFALGSGVALWDSAGYAWKTESAVTVAAGDTATTTAVQLTTRTITHTVTDSAPFYRIEIPPSDDGLYLAGIAVAGYEYAERYVGVSPGDAVYHVETDEFQRMYVQFGWSHHVGIQPATGAVITITVSECGGDIRPKANSPFSFDQLATDQHSQIVLTMSGADPLVLGIDPPDIATLRDLCRYPAVYDPSAVYLGEFDFVVRRNYDAESLLFLSVWNEAVEEEARGPDVANINAIFVAFMSAAETEDSVISPAAPSLIADVDLTAAQEDVRGIITTADSSYKVKFYTPVIVEIDVTVTAVVPAAYSTEIVADQIREAILSKYGRDTQAAKHGRLNPLYQDVYSLLRSTVPALAEAGSDWTLSIEAPPSPLKPEHWRYVSDDSLTVTCTKANTVPASWGFV